MSAAGRVRRAGELVRLSHTVFALPFALIAMLAAAGGVPEPRAVLWIVVAMIGARTAAMAFNRLADRETDAANPRTAGRHLPAGTVSPALAWGLVVGGAVLLVLAAWRLNPLCLALSPLALAWVTAYSYSKRFTSLAHLWLGSALGLAPLGAWLAVRGSFAREPAILAVAVTCWAAGFDIIYSLQDEGFDRSAGLHSLPARLGGRRALIVARWLHAAAALAFVAFAAAIGGGVGLWLAVAAAAALLVWQHSLIAGSRLERIDTAFFTANGALSVAMLALYVLDMILAP